MQTDSARGKVQTFAKEIEMVPVDIHHAPIGHCQRGQKWLKSGDAGHRKADRRPVPAGCFQAVRNRLLLHGFIHPSITPGCESEACLCGPIFFS